jgi:hypothetical protein
MNEQDLNIIIHGLVERPGRGLCFYYSVCGQPVYWPLPRPGVNTGPVWSDGTPPSQKLREQATAKMWPMAVRFLRNSEGNIQWLLGWEDAIAQLLDEDREPAVDDQEPGE